MIRFAIALFLGLTTASAAVVERAAPALPSALVPALTFSMSGPMSASFTPALTGAMNAPSLSAPSPVMVPTFAAPAAELKPVAIAAAALALRPLSAPASGDRDRGPPTARDASFASYVADSVASKVREWAVPSDEILKSHDALVVGENHRSLASVTELARALPGLAKSGVTVLGIEGLKKPNQGAVDAFVSGKAAALPHEVLSFSPDRRAAFETLLKAARDTGVRVVALGVPLDGWARQAAELAAQKTGDPFESFLASPGEQLFRAQAGYEPGYNEAIAEVYLARRNRSMAGFLVEAMVEGAKAVVLVGQNHVQGADKITLRLPDGASAWGDMGKELARLGLKAFSLTLTGGLFVDAAGARDDRAARAASYEEAAKASPGGAPAFKRTGASTGLYHAGGSVPRAPVAH